MYLEKLEVQGFKSFAHKNVLVFPGMLDKTRRGLTAVVGPNGSGKSNVADAIRWTLGEQSMKVLRGKKSEDVIFSGSDKKGKLGMAEVSLFLNNEDGKAPIEYTQVVITRRLYRDGESEYLLNGSKVRLYDIQMLLAKASFGQKTYSVIGQGMVEGFLNTSISERKEFFDEATGVKQFQIKRDDSLNKLLSSHDNLHQAQMLITEIEPRLKSLTRQVSKLQRRGELEVELKGVLFQYYAKLWKENNDKFQEYNKRYLEIEKIKLEREKKAEVLQKELSQIEAQNQGNQEFMAWQQDLAVLQGQKDGLNKQLAKIEAQREVQLEASGQFDLSFLNNKKQEIAKELEIISGEVANLESGLASEKVYVAGLEEERRALSQQMNEANSQIMKLSRQTGGSDADRVNERLKKSLEKLEAAEEEHDAEKLKQIINEIREELREIVAMASGEKERANISELQGQMFSLSEKREELGARIAENNLSVHSKQERLRFLKDQSAKLQNESKSVEDKLRAASEKVSDEELETSARKLREELGKLDIDTSVLRAKVNNFSKAEEEKRSQIFGLQKNYQQLRQEIDQVNRQLNELKISATRYETKLEDLDAEMREEVENVREIKDAETIEDINIEETKEKIHGLKKQLEQIGGIDPEVETEYNTTKERFDFLSTQVNDLNKTIDSLEEIIGELDENIKEKFDKEFKVIAEKFEEYFKILFNGGVAKIIKVMDKDEDNPSTGSGQGGEEGEKKIDDTPNNSKPLSSDEIAYNNKLKRIKYLQKHSATGLAGVEIQATPPGKKIKSVAMLSGGERALTAIALISAIISANPSPFVVLDEVDAALDEANSERLAKILDDLSHKTQFIVITHNRASMRRAAILYGVTMGDDGISKLLSVKLDEVKLTK